MPTLDELEYQLHCAEQDGNHAEADELETQIDQRRKDIGS